MRDPVMGASTARVSTRVAFDGAVNEAIKTGRNRLVLAGALFALAYVAIGVRLVDVALVEEGFEPRFARMAVKGPVQFGRRDIVDRNGVLLAANLPTASLYADPRKVLDTDEAAAKTATVLPGLSHAELVSKLESQRSFVWIKRNLTPRQQVEINRLGLPGFGFQREDRRAYPLGPLFAHVVGFVDVDNRGISGVEKQFDEALRATVRGPGEPLRLSFDTRIQHALREELKLGMAEFRAVGAAGVVLDATNGEVLAMVSLPDFDANRLDQRNGEALFNRATLGAYEMGSTFKVFTVAMALDSGVVTLSDSYDASAPIRVSRFVIRDYKPMNRWLTVQEIFTRSSNIGAAKIALDVGTAAQREFLSRVGLLRPADVELPEVATPIVPSPWREINTMTIAYGHGLAVSPLQFSAAVAAMVNGGVFYPPTIVARAPGEPRLGWRVIAPRTSQRMRRLMHLAVVRGTGGKAAVPGYLVGGKTGTAEKAERRGYRSDALLSSFVAAFPIDAPRYVVFVMYDEPRRVGDMRVRPTGGWTAAPTVGRIVARLGTIAGIAPARLPKSYGGQVEEAVGETGQKPLVKISGGEGPGVAF